MGPRALLACAPGERFLAALSADAEQLVLRLDRRMIPEEDPAQVEATLRQVIAEAAGGMPGIRGDLEWILAECAKVGVKSLEDALEELVGEAGSTMNDIVSQVRGMTSLMAEINKPR